MLVYPEFKLTRLRCRADANRGDPSSPFAVCHARVPPVTFVCDKAELSIMMAARRRPSTADVDYRELTCPRQEAALCSGPRVNIIVDSDGLATDDEINLLKLRCTSTQQNYLRNQLFPNLEVSTYPNTTSIERKARDAHPVTDGTTFPTQLFQYPLPRSTHEVGNAVRHAKRRKTTPKSYVKGYSKK